MRHNISFNIAPYTGFLEINYELIPVFDLRSECYGAVSFLERVPSNVTPFSFKFTRNAT